ncbi:MAG: ribonuclease E/G [Caulobacterales bacterium]
MVDGAIGETREALVENGRVIALRVVRASARGKRARWGEVYSGRITRVDRPRRGAFVDLGLKEEQGFLPLDQKTLSRKGALTDGAGVVVSVTREGARGKGPVLALLPEPYPGGPSQLLERHESDVSLDDAKPADSAMRARIDAAIEDALSLHAPIPGGGALTIEPTAALVAIDVDAGGRVGSGDPERFTLDLNLAAAKEAARQMRLRALGGIVAIDFVSMRQHQNRKQLEAAAKAAFAGDPWQVQFGQISRFGVLEMTRAQMQTPLHEILRDGDGRLSVETLALMALRAIEREGRAVTGRRIAALVAPEIFSWLEETELGWRAALTNRIGMRFTVEAQAGAPRERIDVRAL